MNERTPDRLSDQLRRAIDASGLSRYRICQETGMDQSLMSRFMKGRANISLKFIDRIGQLLGLDLVVRGPDDKEK